MVLRLGLADPVLKLRCDLHLNGGSRKLVLVPGLHETDEHLALKLAAYLLFWDQEPVVEASPRHPALLGQEFIPDLLAVNEAGEISLWVECGKITMHKLGKLTRRFRWARLVVMRENEREALRTRSQVQDELGDKGKLVEILAWPQGAFPGWLGAMADKIEVYGEAGGLGLNLTVNEHPLAVDLKKF